MINIYIIIRENSIWTYLSQICKKSGSSCFETVDTGSRFCIIYNIFFIEAGGDSWGGGSAPAGSGWAAICRIRRRLADSGGGDGDPGATGGAAAAAAQVGVGPGAAAHAGPQIRESQLSGAGQDSRGLTGAQSYYQVRIKAEINILDDDFIMSSLFNFTFIRQNQGESAKGGASAQRRAWPLHRQAESSSW